MSTPCCARPRPAMRDPSRDELQRIAHRVWENLAATRFAGTDPYDGLNSRLLAPALRHSRLLRLAVIQGVKRSPSTCGRCCWCRRG